MAVGQELPINVNASAFQMAQTIFGSGATVVSASYSGDRLSSGIYSNADAVTPGVAPSDSGVILSTGYVRDFTQSSGDPNRSGSTSTNTTGQNDNPLFNGLVGGRTFDAAILTTSFIPTGDVLTISFVFASEEYPEFAGSIFNDAVGIWINGQVVTSPVVNFTQINSINQSANSTLFVNNTGDAYKTEMDGFTVTLSLSIPVTAGVQNTIRIGIADVGDAFNAVVLEGDFSDTLFLEGRGAGGHPTASSVVADICDIARGIRLPVFGVAADQLMPFARAAMRAHAGGYYVALEMRDRPGELAGVAKAFSDEGISIESVIQRGPAVSRSKADADIAPFVLITHDTLESAMRTALDKIEAQGHVASRPRMVRIERL
jgi:hypothetical protein